MIPQSFIDDLLQRVDVVELVGRYVKLKKGGANYVGLCPFHNEKSPSFSVSPTKQFYHCFGCGAHGTALGFLIEYSGLSFPEAVRDLAQGLGMTVPETRRVPDGSVGGPAASEQLVDRDMARSSTVAITEALETATAFYRTALRESPRAIDYLKGRGLTGEVAARFALGYAPDGWTPLEAAFDDYRDIVLVDAGLVIAKESESGDPGDAVAARHYDRFRDRIMFPIRSPRGRVIGFGGRVLGDGEPKYLNSPETAVFQKGNELYGLFEARKAIREEGCAIVVEGYMDVVALAQLGVANAVATLGTACTPQHVQKLLRQTDQVVFSFDGDSAGRRAAWRALESALPIAADDKLLSFLFLPDGHDPDSYVRAQGRDGFLEMVRHAVPLSDYLMRELGAANDLSRAEGRAKLLFDARPLVKALPAGALRMQIVRALASASGASADEILESFQLSGSPRARARAPRIERKAPQGLIQRVLAILIMYPQHACALTGPDLEILEAASGDARDLVTETVAAARSQGASVDFIAMSDALRDSAHAAVYEDLMQDILKLDETRRDLLLHDPDDAKQTARREEQQTLLEHELRDALRKLREQEVLGELARLSAAGLANPENAARYRELVAERARLLRRSAET